ncbi:MAG: hypothetical protein HGB00_08645 [Chlorobiaceae bacterium]|nr:hypothetical protein [Chlorobiaceae bacterium]
MAYGYQGHEEGAMIVVLIDEAVVQIGCFGLFIFDVDEQCEHTYPWMRSVRELKRGCFRWLMLAGSVKASGRRFSNPRPSAW